MTYYINLGGIILYGITSVEDGKEREITAYDGIGQGNFPVPESPKLHTWTIECEMTEKNTDNLPNWSAASKVFAAFDVLLKTTDPSRFIFVSDNRNESMSGHLAGYSKKEKYPGAYDVTIRVTEYKAAGVKTTDVPYIKRPGKAPAAPKTVTFNSTNTPYTLKTDEEKSGDSSNSSGSKTVASGGGGSTSKSAGVGRITVKGTGKPVTNPATLKDGEAYAYSVSKAVSSSSTVKSAMDAIGNAFSSFVASIKGNKGIGGNN
ncbi:MAG: hypothetical protein ACLUDH_13955 [Faecalispora sporosphaeroides]|uniref:hypothetical protein n=1 Tax=Faecalispora sporosphaeroides TaxID=1549 RepID=UPI00206FADCD|nr:MAG TPA: hypothetical protein [Caudoviricetes sp.]